MYRTITEQLKEVPVVSSLTTWAQPAGRSRSLTCQKERWLSELEYVARYRPSGANATAVMGPLWPRMVWQEGENSTAEGSVPGTATVQNRLLSDTNARVHEAFFGKLRVTITVSKN